MTNRRWLSRWRGKIDHWFDWDLISCYLRTFVSSSASASSFCFFFSSTESSLYLIAEWIRQQDRTAKSGTTVLLFFLSFPLSLSLQGSFLSLHPLKHKLTRLGPLDEKRTAFVIFRLCHRGDSFSIDWLIENINPIFRFLPFLLHFNRNSWSPTEKSMKMSWNNN